MVEVAIWRQIRNAMEFDCFNGTCESIWCKKSFREKVLVFVVCPCANDVSERRRQSDKGYRVPVDHSHQVCVCVFWCRLFVVWKVGMEWDGWPDEPFRRWIWKNIRGPKKINRDDAKKAAMSQRCAWKCSCMAGRGSCTIQFGVWVFHVTESKENSCCFDKRVINECVDWQQNRCVMWIEYLNVISLWQCVRSEGFQTWEQAEKAQGSVSGFKVVLRGGQGGILQLLCADAEICVKEMRAGVNTHV